jgi:hypothetical protein
MPLQLSYVLTQKWVINFNRGSDEAISVTTGQAVLVRNFCSYEFLNGKWFFILPLLLFISMG